MIRWNMRMWTTSDPVFPKPTRVNLKKNTTVKSLRFTCPYSKDRHLTITIHFEETHRSQNSQRSHMRLRMKNVVDDALKLERVVGVFHRIVVVWSLQFERVRQNVSSLGTTHFTENDKWKLSNCGNYEPCTVTILPLFRWLKLVLQLQRDRNHWS